MHKLILSLSLVVCGVICGCDGKVIEQQVAKDAKKQYELALKGGNKIEIAVNAGLVAEAYKQAHAEATYLKWRKIADDAKKAAGLKLK